MTSSSPCDLLIVILLEKKKKKKKKKGADGRFKDEGWRNSFGGRGGFGLDEVKVKKELGMGEGEATRGEISNGDEGRVGDKKTGDHRGSLEGKEDLL